MNYGAVIRSAPKAFRAMAAAALSGLVCFALAGEAQDQLRVADLTPITVRPAEQHEPVWLVKDGAALATIYVAEEAPSRRLRLMVGEMVTAIKLASSAEMPVVWSSPPAGGTTPRLVIGDCTASRMAGIDATRIPIEGFAVKSQQNRLYLVGSTQTVPKADNVGSSREGSTWAIADFLERFVGIRWYWPVDVGGRSVVPFKDLTIRPCHYVDQPVFRQRQYHPAGGFPQDLWVARTGGPRPTAKAIPAVIGSIDLSVLLTGLRSGDSTPYSLDPHRPAQLWQNDALVKKFPNLRAWTDDKGGRHTSLLCYSAKETFDFLMAGAEAVWDRHENALPKDPWCGYQHGGEGISWIRGNIMNISPHDASLDCKCPACKQSLNDGGPSKHMARFVSKVSWAVKKRWPDKKVGYMPYWNYRWCNPDVQYADNLEIRLCDTQGGEQWCQPLGMDKGHEERVTLWAQKTATKKLLLWEYPIAVTSKTHAPIQFPHTLRAYYQRRRNDTLGVFLNGHSLGEWSNHAPTMYCWMKLLWNPDLDVDAVMDVFCKRMFAKAAVPMREYLRLGCDGFEEKRVHPAFGDGRENIAGMRALLPVHKMKELREQARQMLHDDPVALQRLEYFTWTFDAFSGGK